MTFEIMYQGHYFPGQRNYHFRWREKGICAQAWKRCRSWHPALVEGQEQPPGWAGSAVEASVRGINFPKVPGNHTSPCGTPWFGQEMVILCQEGWDPHQPRGGHERWWGTSGGAILATGLGSVLAMCVFSWSLVRVSHRSLHTNRERHAQLPGVLPPEDSFWPVVPTGLLPQAF